MKLGAITDEFSEDPAIAAPAMHAAGLETAELRVLWGKNILDLSDAELDKALAILDENELSVDCIASPLLKCTLPGGFPTDERFQRDVFASRHTFEDQPRLSDRAFAVAQKCAAKMVRVFSYWRTADPDAVFERIVDALGELAERASAQGLVIGLENEHACNISTAREAARVLAATDNPSLQIVWDPANAYVAGERPFPDGFQLLPVDRIAHVHAKDCRLIDGHAEWGLIGDGDIDWQGQLSALAAEGYGGHINLETHWAGPGGDKLEGSRLCASRLHRLVAAI